MNESMKQMMKKLTGFLFCFAILFWGCSTVAFAAEVAVAADVEINETNFPDENFREYVKQFDDDNNDTLNTSEASVVVTIDVQDSNITQSGRNRILYGT